jgi:tetratricopeptide (TPR) repeat protein
LSPAQVEFALARLATAGDNYDLATAHIDKVIGLAPGAPSGYEMRALVANETGDDAGFAAAVDRAIELGSRDAVIYMLKAEQVIRDNEQENAAWDDFLPPGPARTAADLYARAIGLLPRNREAYAGLINALLNVDSVTEADQIMLRGGRMLLPTDGLLLVGEAAIEKQRGNEQQAVELLRQARAAPFTLQARFRPAVAALHADWLSRYVFDQFQAHLREGRLDAAQALLSEQLSAGELPQGVRTRFERLQRDALGLERILAAGSAVEAGDVAEARAILTALLNDTQTTPTVRRMAEDRIANLPGGGARPPN